MKVNSQAYLDAFERNKDRTDLSNIDKLRPLQRLYEYLFMELNSMICKELNKDIPVESQTPEKKDQVQDDL